MKAWPREDARLADESIYTPSAASAAVLWSSG